MEFEEKVIISAPPERIWTVLADIGNIHVWNPGVEYSKQTTPGAVGVGAARRCELGGRNYLEEKVIEFDPPRRLTVRITDTNLPFRSADIRFTLAGDGVRTTVTVSPNYDLKFGLIGRILDRVMVRRQYRKGMRGLLRGLKDQVEGQSQAE